MWVIWRQMECNHIDEIRWSVTETHSGFWYHIYISYNSLAIVQYAALPSLLSPAICNGRKRDTRFLVSPAYMTILENNTVEGHRLQDVITACLVITLLTVRRYTRPLFLWRASIVIALPRVDNIQNVGTHHLKTRSLQRVHGWNKQGGQTVSDEMQQTNWKSRTNELMDYIATTMCLRALPSPGVLFPLESSWPSTCTNWKS